MPLDRIAVLGLGRVGRLAAELLAEAGFSVIGVDQRPTGPEARIETVVADLCDPASLEPVLGSVDGVLSCLPYHLNTTIATLAHSLGKHYFDLTEDVATTNVIRELSQSAQALMAPQCGLAPGFVGIVGGHLAEKFETCRGLKMRVGALPQNPNGLLGYAFNWSPEGVVNEYLNDCEVIEGGVRKSVSAMEWQETVYIGGTKLEAFTTSGGLGTMCETYLGRIDNVDYKTLRYPGHVDLMNFFFHELLMRDNREEAGRILTTAKPPVDEDVVYVHIAAEGHRDERLGRVEFVRSYYPRELAGSMRTAIAWTTAGSVTAIIEMVRNGALADRGFLKQELVPFAEFTQTSTGALFLERT